MCLWGKAASLPLQAQTLHLSFPPPSFMPRPALHTVFQILCVTFFYAEACAPQCASNTLRHAAWPALRVLLQVGKLIASVVSAAFPQPMQLKFERVCLPLLLLHVSCCPRRSDRPFPLIRTSPLHATTS
jgi:hypothetical protein